MISWLGLLFFFLVPLLPAAGSTFTGVWGGAGPLGATLRKNTGSGSEARTLPRPQGAGHFILDLNRNAFSPSWSISFGGRPSRPHGRTATRARDTSGNHTRADVELSCADPMFLSVPRFAWPAPRGLRSENTRFVRSRDVVCVGLHDQPDCTGWPVSAVVLC